MRSRRHSILTLGLSLLAMSGCGSDGTDNSVAVTRSISGTIAALANGGSQDVAFSFNSDDGRVLSDLTITDGLSTLPAGWSGPASFSCGAVSTGNGCTLTLAYAPTMASNGTFALTYSYRDNASKSETGSIEVAYTSTAANNVTGTPLPTGQINAVAGSGSQPVNVSFTTDDGNSATALQLTTDLSALPSGWSSDATTFACDSVSTGNGCQLGLTYAPSAVGSGTLELSFGYRDNAGAAKAGTVSIAYASTSSNNVVATTLPSGQLSTTVAGSQNVSVTFTTDDGNTVSDFLVTSDLSALPAGWSGGAGLPGGFSCASVSTGNDCELILTHLPLAVGSGTVSVNYSYVDNSNVAKTGSVNIPYVATVNNNVVSTVDPSGQVDVAVGDPGAPVSVTFETDDGNPASALTLTSDLSALPVGWSSTSGSFDCASVTTGNGCQLSLTYTPLAAATGTLNLNFGYNDNAGSAKTGSVNIPYAGVSGVHAYVAYQSGAVYVCGIESDGTLSNCAITNSGSNQAEGVVVGDDYAYVGDYNANSVNVCAVAGDGSLSNCASTGSDFHYPGRMAINNGFLYVNNGHSGFPLTYCAIAGDGTLSGCAGTSGINGSYGIAFDGGYAYVSNLGANQVVTCSVNIDGSFTSCSSTGSGFTNPTGIAVSGGYAYIGSLATSDVSVCAVDSLTGALSNCTFSTVDYGPTSIAVYNDHAYVSTLSQVVYECAIALDGSLTNCVASNAGLPASTPMQISVH